MIIHFLFTFWPERARRPVVVGLYETAGQEQDEDHRSTQESYQNCWYRETVWQ